MFLAMLLTMLTGCANSVSKTSCQYNRELLQKIPLGDVPVGTIRNEDLAEEIRSRDEQIVLDNTKKDQLQKQLDECQ